MESRKLNLHRILEIYEKIKKWIIGTLIVFILIIFYFGDLLGHWREKLLVAAALSILSILFELLISISNNLKIKPEISKFPSIYEAIPKIKEIVSHDKQITSVKIIAATGGITLGTILPSIILSSPAKKIEISLGILDPNTPYKEWLPPHWSSESEATIKRLKTEEREARVSIHLFLYKILPIPHGMLINDKHLFLGFYGWIESDGNAQLSGAQLPHYYYHIGDPEFTYYFKLFESWFRYLPRA